MNQRLNSVVLSFATVLSGLALSAPQAMASIVLPAGLDNDPTSSRTDIKQCINDAADVFDDRAARLEYGAKLCDVRIAHSEAKLKFVTSLNTTVAYFADQTNHGKNQVVADAAKSTVKMLVACMDANDSTYACHNIQCLIAPEQSATECYTWALTNPGFKRFFDEMVSDQASNQ